MPKLTSPSIHAELEAYLLQLAPLREEGDLFEAAHLCERRGVAELVANLDDQGEVGRLARVAVAAFEEHKK